MKYYTIFLLIILTVSCRAPEKDFHEKKDEGVTYPEPIQKMLDAHGGLDAWKTKSTLSYHVTRGERKEIHTIDLKNRNALINGDGYDIGFNGDQAWMSPDKSAWPDARPRFYHNLIFYFHSLVFLVADSGINISNKGMQEVDGQALIEVSITYQNHVGDSPEDEYVLFINPETYRLEHILYTVTYFTGERRKDYNGLKYTSWKEVDGLLVPDEFVGYTVEGGILAKERYVATFSDIHFSDESPEPSIFDIPEISVIDSLK
ncbi:MAG: hypothetical protein HKN68_06035 [Saprospiraceae bacterium]|nr:hypothetical protein [Saprospiraceae bacterium]